MTDHTATAYDGALLALRSKLSGLGQLVLGQLQRIESAVCGTGADDCEAILRAHGPVLQIQDEVEQLAILTLAKRQPVASDLREIITAMRVARDLCSMSGLAREISSRAMTISSLPGIPTAGSLSQMTRFVVAQAQDVLAAYEAGDDRTARRIWLEDQDLDQLHNQTFAEIAALMARDPRVMRQCICHIMAAKYLERIGDHCTGIAESVVYMVSGERLASPRPKDDQTSVMEV